MATLFRVDSEVDLYPESHDASRLGVPARPSREIFTHEDQPPRRASLGSWLGLLMFVAVMISIITTAAVVALRERVGEGQLSALVRSTLAPLSASFAEPRAPAPARDSDSRTALVPETTLPVVTRAKAAVRAQPASDRPAGLAPTAAAPVLEPITIQLPSSARVVDDVALAEKPRERTARESTRKSRPRKVARARASGRRAQVTPATPAKAARAAWDEARDAAREHYAAGRYAQAAAAYEQAARANPSHALTLAGLGAARMQVGDLAGAAEAYKRSVRLSPANLSLQVALARVYERSGETASARAIYQRVLAADPGHASARGALERL